MEMFNQLVSRTRKTSVTTKKKHYLIDSSTFLLSKPLYDWTSSEQFKLPHTNEDDHEYVKSFLKDPLAVCVLNRDYLDLNRMQGKTEQKGLPTCEKLATAPAFNFLNIFVKILCDESNK